MSYRVHPEEDRREYRSPPQLYQTPEQQQLQPPATSYPRGQRANTPERIRERQVKSVPSPYTHTPVDADFYIKAEDGRIRPNVELLKDHFLHEGRLREDQALFILEQMTQLLSAEPNMLRVAGPVTVCGDIHGQYYDLMKVFEVGGTFANNNYLFLGDYVDRGCFGIECLLYLYAIKLWHPTALFLLRGNHECKHLTEYFTFKRECYHKYSPTVYDACVQSFNALPITALIDGKFFCVHGGISPELQDLSDLDKINRFAEPGDHGLLCDLLWADPIPTFGHEQERTPADPHGLPPGTHWVHNKARGCSFYYTYEAACKFLERNQLLGIFRAHEAQDAGYTMHRKTPTKKFPSVITIFSAPNYLDFYHNRGAVIKYKDRNITIRQYNATSHPYWLPNFMDAFTWSLPFVGSKITEMLLAVLSVCSQEELESSDEDEERGVGDEDETRTTDLALTPNELSQRRQQIKNKILAVGRMQRVFQLLREESEAATELTTQEEYPPSAGTPPGAWPGGFATPPGASDALGVRVNSLQREIRSFDAARRSDMLNERLPQYKPQVVPLVAVPSMRLPSFANADDSLGTNVGDDGGEQNMEALIRKALVDEGINDGGVVERLAEKIARGKKTAGRPKDLKRFETAP